MASFFNNYFFIILAVIVGIASTTQAAINVKLTNFVESPILAAFISFAVGTLALLIYLLASGISLSSIFSIKNAPIYVWTGGILGAFFVASTIMLVPRLGVTLTFSLVIAGQMLISLILDQFGWFGVPVKEINLPRIIGTIFLTVGVILIRKF